MSRQSIQWNARFKILWAAQAQIEQEIAAVKKRLPSLEKITDYYRNGQAFDSLNRFYGPTFPPFMLDIAKAAKVEMAGPQGIDWLETFDPANLIDLHVATFIKEFIEVYILRHLRSSYGQLSSLFAEADPADAINTRLSEWKQRRPEKISKNESVRGAAAMFQAVAFYFGFSTVWKTRGDNCAYCNQLSGRRVLKGEKFLNPGDEIDPQDGEHKPMKVYAPVGHPPAHQSCDCWLSI